MDALDLLGPAALELLSRSDGVLTRAGAPEGHEVLGLLRSVGRLPGDAVAEVVQWRPATLDDRADLLRQQAERYRSAAFELGRPVAWEGAAAAAFAAQARGLGGQLGEIAASTTTLAGLYTELAMWLRVARRQLAQALAAALGSAEAVTLTGPFASAA